MNLVARMSLVPVMILLLAAVLLSGCTAEKAVGSNGAITRSYGASDPCQFTTIDLEPKPGVDLEARGQKLVDGFEGFQAIGDVNFYPRQSRLEVTWCNTMQTEQGVVRAVAQTNLATIGEVKTVPVASK